ncbi:Urmylation protein [Agyrium rufum]|nr:Urmylation protein [Agyrium rufum]
MSSYQQLNTGASSRLLESEEYQRYGRQMILPQIGIQGQLRLKHASILIVGLGGLGCPAATYLAGAGVGTLGLTDGDIVELSNLHRQILHTTETTGWMKVESAEAQLRKQNPHVRVITHKEHLQPRKAIELFSAYDLILDCTDHPTSRYLISDAAVLAGKPLISASALQLDGQLLVLNNPPLPPGIPGGGPCYRCIFPKPPPPDSVLSCGEGGILGPVVGVMGVLMALESIKIITYQSQKSDAPSAEDATPPQDQQPASMLIFSAFSNPPFRSVRLRGKRQTCSACSIQASITKDSLTSQSLDYNVFCGITQPINVLKAEERVSAIQLRELMQTAQPLIVDVRDKTQFDICHLNGSLNIPYRRFDALNMPNDDCPEVSPGDGSQDNLLADLRATAAGRPLYMICRHGNDSQLAVKKIQDLGSEEELGRNVFDVKGGFRAWREQVDTSWPDY